MEWFLLPFKKYADFEGRSRRKEYWMFYLLTSLAGIPLATIDTIIGSMTDSGLGVFSGLFSVSTIIPWFSLSVRRLHDVGKSGKYLLLVFFPIIGWVWLFVLTVIEGDKGSNKYGLDPKNPTSELDEIGVAE